MLGIKYRLLSLCDVFYARYQPDLSCVPPLVPQSLSAPQPTTTTSCDTPTSAADATVYNRRNSSGSHQEPYAIYSLEAQGSHLSPMLEKWLPTPGEQLHRWPCCSRTRVLIARAPKAPTYPSCFINSAWLSPFDQYRNADANLR